ncbi:MAG: tetratricopeptide repeat protein [Thermoanaerobaculales bacterium]|nr:tetratricopeptide repeat protein [Thermoanaerobaculales bacterium]
MKRKFVVVFISVISVVAFAGSDAWAKKPESHPGLYEGKAPRVAADALGDIGLGQAGKGTWQRIRVGRVFYLSGQKEKGQAIFDAILGAKPDAGDWIRIGRVYYEAGEWAEAREIFERVLDLKPNDADWLAEIGAYFNLQGDRERAEELFRRSFDDEPSNHRNTAYVAGSYVGIVPDP